MDDAIYDPNCGTPRLFYLDGWSITNHAAAVFSGTLDLPAVNSARFENLTGASFDVQTDKNLSGAATFNNQGNFYKSSGTNQTTVGWTFNNLGTIEVRSGTLRFQGAVPQVAGSALTSGTWIVKSNAVFDLATASLLTTNQATVVLDGVQSQFSQLSALAVNEGEFRLQSGKAFTTSTDLLNSGIIHLDGLSSLTVNGTFQQTTQATLSLTLPPLTMGATNPPLLVVSNAAILNGTLEVVIPPGVTVLAGQIISLISFASNSGQFTNLIVQAGAGITGDIVYSSTNASFRVLTATEPLHITGASVSNTNLFVTWSGGTPPYVLQMRTNLIQGNWLPIVGPTLATNALAPMDQPAGFMRVVGGQ